jgi:hypothetical protein
MLWTAALSAFWLGFFYFVAAIPSAAALGLPAAWAAVVAVAGYSTGAGVVLLAGTPLQRWWKKRKAATLHAAPAKGVPLWKKAWNFGGLWMFGLIAPVTIGPQVGALIAVGLGEKPLRIWAAFTAGVIPWALAFAIATQLGAGWMKKAIDERPVSLHDAGHAGSIAEVVAFAGAGYPDFQHAARGEAGTRREISAAAAIRDR